MTGVPPAARMLDRVIGFSASAWLDRDRIPFIFGKRTGRKVPSSVLASIEVADAVQADLDSMTAVDVRRRWLDA